MREVPFMKATEALEFSANLAKVQSELMNLLPKDNMRSKKRQMQRPLPLDEMGSKIKSIESARDLPEDQYKS
jgi:hypothetical protein